MTMNEGEKQLNDCMGNALSMTAERQKRLVTFCHKELLFQRFTKVIRMQSTNGVSDEKGDAN